MHLTYGSTNCHIDIRHVTVTLHAESFQFFVTFYHIVIVQKGISCRESRRTDQMVDILQGCEFSIIQQNETINYLQLLPSGFCNGSLTLPYLCMDISPFCQAELDRTDFMLTIRLHVSKFTKFPRRYLTNLFT